MTYNTKKALSGAKMPNLGEKKTNLNEPEVKKFSDLGISESILKILANLHLEIPTPIQWKTIPVAITGQDVIGVAQTGTGKTFAFGIPMLERLGRLKGQGLIIAPTRELALQVEESIRKLGHSLGLRTAVLIGGEAIDRQLFQLRKRPHIVVATPGRLIDHLARHTFKLDQINTLVLDEADMMLDLGFAPQIQEILKQAPTDRQTMLFSATMPAAIVKIATHYMKLPVSIEVAPSGTTAADVDQEIFIIHGEERLEHLDKILQKYKGSVLVFVRTKHGVKNLTMKLQSLNHRATEIHSNLSLNRRRAALEDFKTKRVRILVATDVAARGLDVSGIELVVNYNLPDNSEDYVHRIGRTGRAGQVGKAISFATTSEFREIRDIERLINKEIKRTEFVKFSHERPAAPVSKQRRGPRRPDGHHGQFSSRLSENSSRPFVRTADKSSRSASSRSSQPSRSSHSSSHSSLRHSTSHSPARHPKHSPARPSVRPAAHSSARSTSRYGFNF